MADPSEAYVCRRPTGPFPRPAKVRKRDGDGETESKIGDDLDPVYPFCTLAAIGPLPPLFQAGDGLQINGTKLEVKVLDPVVIKNTAVSVKFDNCSIGLNKNGELSVIPRVVFQITTELPIAMRNNNGFYVVYDKEKGLITMFPGIGLSVRFDESYFIVNDSGTLRLWWSSDKYVSCQTPIVKLPEGISLSIEKPLEVRNDALSLGISGVNPMQLDSAVHAVRINLASTDFDLTADGKLKISANYNFLPNTTEPILGISNVLSLNMRDGLQVASGKLTIRSAGAVAIASDGVMKIQPGLGVMLLRGGRVDVIGEKGVEVKDGVLRLVIDSSLFEIENYSLALKIPSKSGFIVSNENLTLDLGKGLQFKEQQLQLKIESAYSWQYLNFDADGYLTTQSGKLEFDSEGYLVLT